MRVVATGVLIGVLVGSAVVGPVSQAEPAPDIAQAKVLYRAAEAAMAEGRYLDAVRDYGAAYDITRDPVLFYKIGSANERAGKCDVAQIYYDRYIRQARPSPAFVELARERIRACGGDARNASGGQVPAPGDAAPEPAIGGAGSAAAGSAAAPGAGPADAATPAPDVGAGSAAAPPEPPAPGLPAGRDRAAWLLVTGSIAFATVGAVLAYSAGSAENDVRDLYVGFAGRPPVFDARTQRTYDALIDEGNRYEKLSWISFGLAGVTAVAATILFVRSDADDRLEVAPTVGREGGGVRATLRF